MVLIIGAGGGDDVMRVDHVDPVTDQVIVTIPLPFGYGHHLYALGGSIIAQTNVTHDLNVGDAFLNVIDSTTDAVTSTSPARGIPFVGDDQIWAETPEGLVQLDSHDGSVLSTFDVPNARWIAAIGNGGVWFFDSHAELHHLNADIGEIDVSVDTSLAGLSVASSGEALWLLGYDGTLTRVQIS